jgi:hypothetical protein
MGVGGGVAVLDADAIRGINDVFDGSICFGALEEGDMDGVSKDST